MQRLYAIAAYVAKRLINQPPGPRSRCPESCSSSGAAPVVPQRADCAAQVTQVYRNLAKSLEAAGATVLSCDSPGTQRMEAGDVRRLQRRCRGGS